MTRKAPRRTAERILEITLTLFNRFGEANVSTGMIAAELGISQGNLYYHYPSKDALVQALFARYVQDIAPLLEAAEEIADVEDAWFFIHRLFECLWSHRFVYRDINDLLSNNRQLEHTLQDMLKRKIAAFTKAIQGLQRNGQLAPMDASSQSSLAISMTLVLSYWLSFEFVCDPRHAMEESYCGAALLRGVRQVLALLTPYLHPEPRQHLLTLANAYTSQPILDPSTP